MSSRMEQIIEEIEEYIDNCNISHYPVRKLLLIRMS